MMWAMSPGTSSFLQLLAVRVLVCLVVVGGLACDGQMRGNLNLGGSSDDSPESGDQTGGGDSDEDSGEEGGEEGGDNDSENDPDEATGSPSAGCGKPSSAVGSEIEAGGKDRSYQLYLPSGYDSDRAYPLVFAWHGLGGSGWLAQAYFGIEEEVGSDGILVYPDAEPLPSAGWATGWELDPDGYDFEFFDALHEHLTERLCVDLDRVFSTGHSFGAYLSNSLGCYRPEVLRAIAPVAGGPMRSGECTGAVAAWIAHGSADTVVLLSEGESTRDKWQVYNDCSDKSATTKPSPCVAYEGCARDLHWCEHSGQHEWPAFAASAIWNFFESQ